MSLEGRERGETIPQDVEARAPRRKAPERAKRREPFTRRFTTRSLMFVQASEATRAVHAPLHDAKRVLPPAARSPKGERGLWGEPAAQSPPRGGRGRTVGGIKESL
jgi:hypothetical protein